MAADAASAASNAGAVAVAVTAAPERWYTFTCCCDALHEILVAAGLKTGSQLRRC